jgi:uncharacterized membrane protein HdeD (DUF308 family)
MSTFPNMADFPFVNALVKNWWIFLIRGIFALLFGVLAFAMPGVTLITLVLLFGVYTLADGIMSLFVGGIMRAWRLVLAGVLGVIVGTLAFIYPGITAVALLYLIAAWAIMRGIFEIVAAIELRKEISNEWVLILGGIISILFGMVLLSSPASGALALLWVIGAYALVFGLVMIVFAFRLRGLPGRFEKLAKGE